MQYWKETYNKTGTNKEFIKAYEVSERSREISVSQWHISMSFPAKRGTKKALNNKNFHIVHKKKPRKANQGIIQKKTNIDRHLYLSFFYYFQSGHKEMQKNNE